MKIFVSPSNAQGNGTRSALRRSPRRSKLPRQTAGTLTCGGHRQRRRSARGRTRSDKLDEVLLVEHDLLGKLHARRLLPRAAAGYRISQARPGALPAHLSGPRFRAQAGRIARQRHDRRLRRLPPRKRQAHFRAPDVSGQTAADVIFTGAAPWFASFQSGAFRADLARAAPSGESSA